MAKRSTEPSTDLTVTTIETTTLTPENVEIEAKRVAMRIGGLLLMAMAEKGLTEKQLADMLEISQRSLRNQLMGEGWRSYLPVAALALALNAKLDLRLLTGD